MEKCDGLIVCQMSGWQDSYGLAHEIEYFEAANKPILHMPWDESSA